MAFGSSQHGAIAIDVGAHSLRLVQLASGAGRMSVAAARQAPSVRGADPAGAFAANLDAITTLLNAGGFRGRRVVTCLPQAAVRVKNFRLPCMPEDELEQAVRFEALERFQSLDAEPEIRCYNAGRVDSGQGEQYELIVTAVRGDVIEGMLSSAARAGLSVETIDFGPAASFRPFERFLKRAEDAGQINAFLDLGHNGARLVITQGDDITFIKQLDTGLASIEGAVAKSLGVCPDEARTLCGVIAGGAADDQHTGAPDERVPAVLAAMEPAVEQIGKEIGLCLRYFSVTFRGLRPEGITCVGGGARNAHLLGRLTDIVGSPVRPGNPLKNIDTEKVFTGADRRSGQPEWATAVGLAMRGLAPSRAAAPATREAVGA